MTDIRKLSREIAEALLKEYAPGQPRTKSGRFDTTGGRGGGGGGVAEVATGAPSGARMRDLSPGSPTLGKDVKVNFVKVPAKVQDDIGKLRAEGGHSLTKHIGADGKLTAERAKLHRDLAGRQSLSEADVAKVGVARADGKPTLVILGGGGGAGKSTLLDTIDTKDPSFKKELDALGITIPSAKIKHNEDGTSEKIKDAGGVHRTAAVVNADHAKAGLWSADESTRGEKSITSGGTTRRMTAASQVHEESSVVAQRALEINVARGADVILDGTGDGSGSKRLAQFEGASTTHDVVGVFVTTRIGTTADDGVRGDVARRNGKALTLSDGASVVRAVPDDLIVSAHRASNAAFLQGISQPGTMFHRAVVYERSPVLSATGTHVLDASGRPQYKFTLAGHFDGTTFHEIVPGIRQRMAARARTDERGKDMSLPENHGLNEAIKEAGEDVQGASNLPYWMLLNLYNEIVLGVSEDASTVLDEFPDAQADWDRISAYVAAAPQDVVIDIPAEISDRSIRLQNIYPNSPSQEPPVNGVKEAAMPLAAHDNALYDAYEKILSQHGKWAQSGADSARYLNESPSLAKGIMCGNCVFYIEDGACELVEGTIRPEGGCKLNIPEPITEGTPGRRRALRALARAKVKNKVRIKAGKKPMISGKEIPVSKFVKKYGDPRKGTA
jgi:hypothetical protein